MSRIFGLVAFFVLSLVTTAQAQSLAQELSNLDKECAGDISNFTWMRLELASLMAATLVGGTGAEDWSDLRRQVDHLVANATARQARLERLGKLHKWSAKEQPGLRKPLTFIGWWQALNERNRQLMGSLRSAQKLFQ